MARLTGGLFFVSLLLHELSHSVFAKSHGIAVRETPAARHNFAAVRRQS
jgi:Zn-dependent protease